MAPATTSLTSLSNNSSSSSALNTAFLKDPSPSWSSRASLRRLRKGINSNGSSNNNNNTNKVGPRNVLACSVLLLDGETYCARVRVSTAAVLGSNQSLSVLVDITVQSTASGADLLELVFVHLGLTSERHRRHFGLRFSSSSSSSSSNNNNSQWLQVDKGIKRQAKDLKLKGKLLIKNQQQQE